MEKMTKAVRNRLRDRICQQCNAAPATHQVRYIGHGVYSIGRFVYGPQ